MADDAATTGQGIIPRGTAECARPPRIDVARFLFIAAVIAASSWVWGDALVRGLVPIFRTEIELLDETFGVRHLAIDRAGSETVYRLEVTQARPIVLGGVAYAPDSRGRAYATAPAAHVTLALILIGAIAFSPSAATWWSIVRRFVLASCAVGILWALDVPVCLLGAVWDLCIAATAPGEFSPWVWWLRFLEHGGRFALAVAFGAACPFVDSAWTRRNDRSAG